MDDRGKVQTVLKRANPDLRRYLNLDEELLRNLEATDPEVISEEEREDINILIGAKKIDKLLDLIKKKPVKVYFQFMEVLKVDFDLYTKVKAIEDTVFTGDTGGIPSTWSQVSSSNNPPAPLNQGHTGGILSTSSQVSSSNNPPAPLYQVVSDNDVADILDLFNFAQLDDVYVRLGLTHDDIENTKLDGNTSKDKHRKVLNLWCKRKSDAAIRGELFRAMEMCQDCKASMDKLKNKWGCL